MSRPHSPRAAWVRLTLTAAFVVVTVSPFVPRRDLSGQAANAKLTTVLADLASSVRQVQGPAVQDRAGQSGPLSMQTMPRSVRDAAQTHRLRLDANNAVQVYLLMREVTADTVQQVIDAGAAIEITDAPHNRVQARVPVARLQAIAALPSVSFVRLPTYGVRRTGSVTTEGDAILHSDTVRSQLGLDGTGIKVGVISDGLKGVFASGCTSCSGIASGPIARGDLPSATGARTTGGVLISSSGGITGQSFQANGDLEGIITNCSANPGAGAEGTALLEVVHDVAPNAQLSFANFDTDLAFNQAVNRLAATNDVVMDDIGFYGEAYDGTSPVSANTAAALNNPANRIRTYVTAVGNAADEHYFGTYFDSGVDGATVPGITNTGRLHQFQPGPTTTDVLGRGAQPYNLISLPQNGEVVIFLTWNDPFGRSANNYDLYLVQESTGAVVAKSTDPQNGGQDPLEVIDYVNPTACTGTGCLFRIVVQNVGNLAAPRDLNLFSFQPECAADGPRLLASGHHERHNYNTATRSVSAQSDSGGSPVSVVSVGAICSGSSAANAAFVGNESCQDGTHSTIEFYSSRGPTLDGRTKPDVSGIDGVSVTGAGRFSNPFFGTSAATPHVGAIAALVLQGAPCLLSGASGAADPVTARTTLRNYLVNQAAALGDANTFGSGLVNALASVQATLPAYGGSGTLTVNANTPTGASVPASQIGFSDPSQCAISKLSWTGGCGTSPGTALACPFGTTTVSVSASNNGVSFSSPVSVAITVSSYTVGATPTTATLSAGQSASYQVSVSAKDGAFTAPVTLGCSRLPPLASCSFNPPTVVPGAGTAQSTLTISTTAPASVAPGGGGSLAPPRPGTLAALAALLLSLIALRRWLHLAGRAGWSRAAALGLACASLAILIVQVACGSNPAPTPTPTASVSLSPASLTFPAQFVQTTSSAQTITLTNSGKAALTLTSITASGDFSQTNTCGSSLAAGATCAISVSFAPASAGTRTGALTIVDSAAGSPHSASLSGTGQTPNGTPSGTYQVSVGATSGTLVQSAGVTVVVR